MNRIPGVTVVKTEQFSLCDCHFFDPYDYVIQHAELILVYSNEH